MIQTDSYQAFFSSVPCLIVCIWFCSLSLMGISTVLVVSEAFLKIKWLFFWDTWIQLFFQATGLVCMSPDTSIFHLIRIENWGPQVVAMASDTATPSITSFQIAKSLAYLLCCLETQNQPWLPRLLMNLTGASRRLYTISSYFWCAPPFIPT